MFAAEIDLANNFKDFIHELLKTMGKNKIIFMFDDIDLSPGRANEVLDMLLKYLDSEDIITFISADEEKLNENLRIHFFKDHEVLEHIDKETQDKGKIKESINEYVYDLLKKIMPPTKRYPLIELNKQAILKFSLSDTSDEQMNFEVLLSQFLESSYENLEESEDLKFSLEIYVDIFADLFDNRPRGLMSICSFIMNNDLKTVDEDQLFIVHKEFMDLIITTNRKIEKKRDVINDFISIKADKERIVLNFNVLTSILQESSYEITKQDKEAYFIILKLGYFMMFVFANNSKYSTKFSETLNLIFSSGYINDLYPRIDQADVLFLLSDEITQITSFHNQFMMLRNKEYQSLLQDFIETYEDDIFDSVWLEEFKSQTSSELNQIIKGYEGIDYDPSILMNIVHLNNSDTDTDDDKNQIAELIEIGALSNLLQDMIANYDSENLSTDYNFIGLVDEIKSRNRVMRIDDYYLSKYADVQFDDYGDIPLIDYLDNINMGINIVQGLAKYLQSLEDDYCSYYSGSALSRVNNYILRNFDEVHIEYAIEGENSDDYNRFSKKSKWISEKPLKNYIVQALRKQHSLSERQLNEAIDEKGTISNQIDIDDLFVQKKLNENISYLFDYLKLTYNNEIIYFDIDESVGHKSTHTMVRKYLEKLLHGYVIEEVFLPELLNLILTLQEKMAKFTIGSLIKKLETYLDDLKDDFEDLDDDFEVLDDDFEEFDDDFEVLDDEENFALVENFDIDEASEHIEELLKELAESDAFLDKKDLRQSSSIIKELNVRLNPLNMNINLINDVAKYSTNEIVTENANTIADKIIKSGYVLLSEVKEFIERVNHLIHKSSDNINDMKVSTLVDAINKEVQSVEEKYESEDSMVKLEKKVWKAYKDALTDEVKKSMMDELGLIDGEK